MVEVVRHAPRDAAGQRPCVSESLCTQRTEGRGMKCPHKNPISVSRTISSSSPPCALYSLKNFADWSVGSNGRRQSRGHSDSPSRVAARALPNFHAALSSQMPGQGPFSCATMPGWHGASGAHDLLEAFHPGRMLSASESRIMPRSTPSKRMLRSPGGSAAVPAGQVPAGAASAPHLWPAPPWMILGTRVEALSPTASSFCWAEEGAE